MNAVLVISHVDRANSPKCHSSQSSANTLHAFTANHRCVSTLDAILASVADDGLVSNNLVFRSDSHCTTPHCTALQRARQLIADSDRRPPRFLPGSLLRLLV